jgi:DNA topoisomerase-1
LEKQYIIYNISLKIMSKNHLVIVESGTKASTIQKYLTSLNKDVKYTVVACNGHICDLIKKHKNFGIDEKTNEPIYEIIKDKRKIIDNLIKLTKQNNLVYLAADNDREGEAIAWHLKNILKPNAYKRIIFNEITKDALNHAILNPIDINMNLVDSQQTRRVLDRLIGFNMTKSLWKAFSSSGTLSAGRVQSVILMLIVEKEIEITQHVSEQYWNVYNTFKDIGVENAKLYYNNNICKIYAKDNLNDKYIQTILSSQRTRNNEQAITKILQKLEKVYYINPNENINNVIKTIKENPDLPFTTSTLQQKAYNEIGFSIKQTMSVAQELYEKGFITYMRTDNTSINPSMSEKIKEYIANEYENRYVNSGTIKSKIQKNAQQAHEAIRPTDLTKEIGKLSDLCKKLYMLIFKRTIASFMTPCIYEELNLNIYNKRLPKDLYFIGKMKIIVEPGFKIIYDIKSNKTSLKDVYNKIKGNAKIISKEIKINCIWSSPPQRYNESNLIKLMEDKGIGRPSTYVSIINKLYERMYMSKQNVNGIEFEYKDIYIFPNESKILKETKSIEEKNKIVPSDIGKKISNFISKYYNDIVNVQYTNKMENTLDDIANGNTTYKKTISSVLQDISLKNKELNTVDILKDDLKKSINEFEINKKKYIIRYARYGPVIETPGLSKSKDKPEKSSFTDLSQYLKFTKMNINDICKKDISFLIQFPIKYKDYIIKYGRHGFYVENLKTKKTLSIYNKFEKNMKNNEFEFIETMFNK